LGDFYDEMIFMIMDDELFKMYLTQSSQWNKTNVIAEMQFKSLFDSKSNRKLKS